MDFVSCARFIVAHVQEKDDDGQLLNAMVATRLSEELVNLVDIVGT